VGCFAPREETVLEGDGVGVGLLRELKGLLAKNVTETSWKMMLGEKGSLMLLCTAIRENENQKNGEEGGEEPGN